jgi:non-canonical (house-cleaning) NTP pyrophosphatase
VRGNVLKRLQDGEEMSAVMNELTGDTDIGNKGGMMGAITNGHVARGPCYEHGIFFAFAPFTSNKVFWK